MSLLLARGNSLWSKKLKFTAYYQKPGRSFPRIRNFPGKKVEEKKKKKKKERKMHDFCFTIPYGLIVVIGGVVGYLKKGSTASLGGGVGSGLVLILAGCLSLKAFERRKNSYFALILETGFENFSVFIFEFLVFIGK